MLRRVPHFLVPWPNAIVVWTGLVSVVLTGLICWLAYPRFQQIDRLEQTTTLEQEGLGFTERGVAVVETAGRYNVRSAPGAERDLEVALSQLTAYARALPILPVALKRAQALQDTWRRSRRDDRAIAALGNDAVDAIADVADASRLAFEPQVDAGDIGDAFDATYVSAFESLNEAFNTASVVRLGMPATVDQRIAIAGYLAQVDADVQPLAIDMTGAFEATARLRPALEPLWHQVTEAQSGLREPVAALLHGAPLTPDVAATLATRHESVIETSVSYFDALDAAMHALLAERLDSLSQSRSALLAGVVAGTFVALLLGLSLGAAARRRHTRELRNAQRDALALTTELARQQAERALSTSQAQFRAVFERSQLGMALLANDGRTLEANDALQSMLGGEGSQLATPQDPHFAAIVETRQGTYQRERLLHREDGKIVWIELTISPVAVPDPGEIAAIAMVQDISERKAADERLIHAATHDELTGLPNRSEFVRQLNDVLAQGPLAVAKCAVLFIDLDELKLVNDALGHFAGDRVLGATARRLRSTCRPADVVARFHGDEFAVLMHDVPDELTAQAAADRIQKELRAPIAVGGTTVLVTCSVGFLKLDDRYVDAEKILRNADAAMYHAKQQGGSRAAAFEDSMSERVAGRFRIATDLRRGIENGEFSLAYQPIISLADQMPVGVEALMRWKHPVYGEISPVDFIPIAEESNAILELGRFALREAAAMLARLDRDHPAIAPGSISVNLSVAQILGVGGNLADDVHALLAENGLKGNRLLLEVTESALMEKGEHALALFNTLRREGVRLCIDDFGTGYSSLRYLHEFPFDVLKIDRSFVSGTSGKIANEPIVAMLMRLAESLKVTVVAEGIETEEQSTKLREEGCRFGQGFLFSRPLEETALVGWLEAAAKRVRRPLLRVASDRYGA